MALGRLVTSVDGEPEIFPVNFVVQHRTVLFRTAEGTKLVSAAINNNVVFEADDHNVAEGWSVIVRGVARTLGTDEEMQGGRTSAAAAVDRDGQTPLCSRTSVQDHRPPLPVRFRTRPGGHVRLSPCSTEVLPEERNDALAGIAGSRLVEPSGHERRDQFVHDRLIVGAVIVHETVSGTGISLDVTLDVGGSQDLLDSIGTLRMPDHRSRSPKLPTIGQARAQARATSLVGPPEFTLAAVKL